MEPPLIGFLARKFSDAEVLSSALTLLIFAPQAGLESGKMSARPTTLRHSGSESKGVIPRNKEWLLKITNPD
jgi:hypothetical protein